MAQIWIPGAAAVAIKCKDAVILGNDTRSTWGYTVNSKSTSKIFPITKDGMVAISCYGLIGDFQALSRIMLAQANIYEIREGVKISVQAMAKTVANYLYQRKMAPLYTNVLVGGMGEKGPAVFTMDAIGSLSEDDYGVAGSAATYAVGILEAEYKPDMTVKEGVKLMKKVIHNAVKRDALAGNAMDIMTITAKGAKSERIPMKDLGE
ncbi:MAG: proteasome subunit beta [Promethearchaeota archaeon]